MSKQQTLCIHWEQVCTYIDNDMSIVTRNTVKLIMKVVLVAILVQTM